MKTLVALLTLLVLAPAASAAEPLARIDIGPPQDPDKGYYVRVDLLAPRPPREGTPADDCAADARPAGAHDSAKRLLAPFLSPNVSGFPGVSSFVPTCVAATAAVDAGVCGGFLLVCDLPVALAYRSAPLAYASYDVTNGRLYAEGPGGSSPTAAGGPIGLAADCEYCPPPTLN